MFDINKRKQAGFTMLEVIMVIVIVAIVGGVAATFFISIFKNTQPLDAAATDLRELLREAQGNAIALVNTANWGVRVVNVSGSASYAELFYNASATTYVGGTVTKTIYFSNSVDLSSPAEAANTDIVFNKRDGTSASASAQTVTFYLVSNSSKTRTLTTRVQGGIEVQ